MLSEFFCLFLLPPLATSAAGVQQVKAERPLWFRDMQTVSSLCGFCNEQMNLSLHLSFHTPEAGSLISSLRGHLGAFAALKFYFFGAKLWIKLGISYLNNYSGGNGIICRGMEN